MASCCASLHSDTFSKMLMPEVMGHRHLGHVYKKYPIIARAIATPIALLIGSLKVFYFPVLCAAGVLGIPIYIASNECCSSDNQDIRGLLKAWCFCLLGTAVSALFIIVAAYHLTLTTSAILFVGFLSISIAAHVNQYVKEPPLFSQ